MSSPSPNRTIFPAAALTLLVLVALPGAGLAADSPDTDASEDSPGAGVGDGSVFCDPATLPEGAICSLTPDREPDESDAPTQAPAGKASAERLPVSAADPGEGETGGDETAGGASAARTGDVGSLPLARTGFRVWVPVVLGACLLLGGVSLRAALRSGRLHG